MAETTLVEVQGKVCEYGKRPQGVAGVQTAWMIVGRPQLATYSNACDPPCTSLLAGFQPKDDALRRWPGRNRDGGHPALCFYSVWRHQGGQHPHCEHMAHRLPMSPLPSSLSDRARSPTHSAAPFKPGHGTASKYYGGIKGATGTVPAGSSDGEASRVWLRGIP